MQGLACRFLERKAMAKPARRERAVSTGHMDAALHVFSSARALFIYFLYDEARL